MKTIKKNKTSKPYNFLYYHKHYNAFINAIGIIYKYLKWEH